MGIPANYQSLFTAPDLANINLKMWHQRLWLLAQAELQEHYPGLRAEHLWRAFADHHQMGEQQLQRAINLSLLPQLESWLRHLLAGRPLAHWVGRSWFHHISLAVDGHVLIPRPESEILVEKAVALLKKHPAPLVVDVGTGPGTLAIALGHSLPQARLWACDVCPRALELASWNRFLWRMEDRLELAQSDRLASLPPQYAHQVDLLVSNPPYIKRRAHLHMVHPQVVKHEPALALFLDDDQYINWHMDFFTQIHGALKSGGHFLVEGHEEELENIKREISARHFGNLQIINDDNRSPRFLAGQKI